MMSMLSLELRAESLEPGRRGAIRSVDLLSALDSRL
jgi:hypothetical protein